MAMAYFCAYYSFLDSVEALSREEAGNLFVACLRYGKTGEEPVLTGSERILWPMVKDQIDRDKMHYEKKCEKLKANASKRKQLQTDESNCKQLQADDPQRKGEGKGKGKGNTPKGVGHFVPPTINEVRAYCSERRNGVDPVRFFDFYTANGWVQGKGKPLKDWKAAVRNWERSEFRHGQTAVFEDDSEVML